MSSRHIQQLAVAALATSGVLWGLMWMPLKHFAAQGLSGVSVTLVTYGALGVAALPWILRQRAAWRGQGNLLALSGLSGGLSNLGFVTALMSGQVVRVMLLFYLAPAWAALGGRLYLGERITPLRSLAVAMAILGAFLVLGGPETFDAPASLADALALAAGLFYAGQNLAARAADRSPILTKTVCVFAGSGAVAGIAWLSGLGHVPQPTAPVIWQLAAFSVLWMTAAMWTTMYGVTHLEAARAGVLLAFELVAAVASAMLIGGEHLPPIGWAGAALITAAAVVQAHTQSGPRSEQAQPRVYP